MAEPRSNAWLTVAILAGVAAIVLAIPKRAFAQEVVTGPVRDATPGAPARSPLPVEQDPSGAAVYRLDPGLDYFLRIENSALATTDDLKVQLRALGVVPVVTYESALQLDPRWPLDLRAAPTPGTRWIGARVAAPTTIPADGITAWGT